MAEYFIHNTFDWDLTQNATALVVAAKHVQNNS